MLMATAMIERHDDQDHRHHEILGAHEDVAVRIQKRADQGRRGFDFQRIIGEHLGVLDDAADLVELFAIADADPNQVEAFVRQGMGGAVVLALVFVKRLVEVIEPHDGARVITAIGQDADDLELQVDPLVVHARQSETLADASC